MPIANVKVYLDGSHPIAIPPPEFPPPKRKGKKKQYLKQIALPVSEDENNPQIKKKKRKPSMLKTEQKTAVKLSI